MSGCGAAVAVRPGEDVGQQDAQTETARQLDHAGEAPHGVLDGAFLRDVVDAALDDDCGRPFDGSAQARRNLVGALAVDAVIAELDAVRSPRRPPQPLAPLVGRVDAGANGGIRIPERRSRGDRVAEARDDHDDVASGAIERISAA
jgi:hypothetical protein